MSLLGLPGISEGLELLILLMALLILSLFAARSVSFSLRLRKVRRENMELAAHMKAKLKTARFRSSSDFDEEDDEMFRGPAVRAKAPVIPASYEARLAKPRRKAARKKAAGKAAKRKARKPRRPARQKKARSVRKK
jgi:hypothetical protein